MSLAARAAAPKGSYPRTPCSVRTLLDTLPKGEAKALQDMLDAPWRIWTHKAIEAAVTDEGHHIGDQQVGRHRRGQCSCGDAA
jgi:hypothetical protein